MRKEEKKAQVTLFIILGVLAVAIVLFFLLLFPKIKTSQFQEQNPSQYLDSCIKTDLAEAVEKVSLQGGSISPEHYIIYNGDNIEYLCYSSEYYKPCNVQRPLLKAHIESEIAEELSPLADECLRKLKIEYEGRGFQASIKQGELQAELLPKRVVLNFNSSLSVSKEGSQNYDSLSVVLNNNLYEFASIALSIIKWEAAYGDAETTTYMNYYHDLKVEKKKQIEGSTIYILTDRNTENKFQFASRSIALPAGYGV